MARIEDLQRLEESRKKKLRLLLAGILLSVDSEQELIPKLKKFSITVLEEVKDIRKASFAIADRYSEETHRAKDGDRLLLLMGASLYLLSNMARRIAISDKENYLGAAREAIRNGEADIDRLVATEIYEANRKKMMSNNKGSVFLWNAVLDKRTCSICEALDGKTFKEADAPDSVHPNCRCILEIVSE
jgi:SPP1 gp7 family putative phage head morphogenesis protein